MLNNYATIKLDRWGIIETTSAHDSYIAAVQHAELMKRFHDVDLMIVDYAKLSANIPCKYVYEGVGDMCSSVEADHDEIIKKHDFIA